MADCRSGSFSSSVTTSLLPVEDTVALLSETPPVVPAPSLMNIRFCCTSASPAFTVSPNVSVSIPVPSSRSGTVFESSAGGVVSCVIDAPTPAVAANCLSEVSFTALATT